MNFKSLLAAAAIAMSSTGALASQYYMVLPVGASATTGAPVAPEGPFTDAGELVTTPENAVAMADLLANAQHAALHDAFVMHFSVQHDAQVYPAGSEVELAAGRLMIEASGMMTFEPTADWRGSVPLVTYTISAGGTTVTSELAIQVTPVATPANILVHMFGGSGQVDYEGYDGYLLQFEVAPTDLDYSETVSGISITHHPDMLLPHGTPGPDSVTTLPLTSDGDGYIVTVDAVTHAVTVFMRVYVPHDYTGPLAVTITATTADGMSTAVSSVLAEY